jgi:hypothetical protein
MDLKKNMYICNMIEDITYKTCSKCGEEKLLTDFYKNKNCKDGYRNVCKDCCKEKQNQYRNDNRDIVLEKKKKYYYDNRDIILEKKKTEYYESEYNKTENVILRKEERHNKALQNKKEYQKEYRNKRWKEDGLFRLKYNIRRRIKDFLDNKVLQTEKIVGCSWEELKRHLESQFKEGMTWDNYGQYGWHIDHHIPLKSANTEEEIIKLNHYTNLKPLWWYENLSKGDKLPEEMI